MQSKNIYSKRARWSAVSVVVLVLLSSCVATASDDGVASPSAVAPSPSDDGSLDQFESVNFRLASEEYMSLIGLGLQQATEAELRHMAELRLRQQELIAQCMNEAGFEYIPFVPEASRDDSTPVFGSPEFISQYGFGNLPRAAVVEEVVVDPNIAIRENMTDAEGAAFQEALQGPPPDAADVGVADGSPIIGGCQGWAMEQVSVDIPDDGFSQDAANLWNSDEFAPLRSAFNQRFVGIENHPDLITLEQEWANCMADAGYPMFERRSDTQDWSWNNAQAFTNEWTADWNTGERKPGWETALAEAQTEDIAVALATNNCDTSINYMPRVNRVTFEIDKQFLEDHQTAFNALSTAAAQGK